MKTFIKLGFTFPMLAVSQASETCLKFTSKGPSSGMSTYLHCPGQCCGTETSRYCCRKESFPVAGIAGIAIASTALIFIVLCVVRHWRRSTRRHEQSNGSPPFTVQTTPAVPPPTQYSAPPSYDECVSKTPPLACTISPPPYSSIVDVAHSRG